MRRVVMLLTIFSAVLAACAPPAVPITGSGVPPTARVEVFTPVSATATRPAATVTPAPSATAVATATLRPSATPTPQPAGVIHVDTLEQETYPFPENGNCSLAEAISAANLLRPVDGCAAGVENATTIELMPGVYVLSRLDNTPQQAEWAVHVAEHGNALPAIARPLTIHGNGAVLSREGAAEPFRILEVLYGALALENITLQGGDVGMDDWGGAVWVQHASLALDNVQVLRSKAQNGGGVYLTDGGLTIRDSLFEGNEAGFSGGGLYADTTKANISNTRFVENIADGFGGGMYADRITLTLTDSLFLRNVNHGTWGGGLSIETAQATILRTQFYRNEVGNVGGGAGFRNLIYEEDIAEAEQDPLDLLSQSEFFQQYSTQIPGFRETLQASPSGGFQAIKLDIQIHDSCFAGNITHFPGDPNWTSAINGRSSAENNYYGDPSGPGGMGPGTGDMVGKMIAFEPFLTQPPAHCDLSLAK